MTPSVSQCIEYLIWLIEFLTHSTMAVKLKQGKFMRWYKVEVISLLMTALGERPEFSVFMVLKATQVNIS